MSNFDTSIPTGVAFDQNPAPGHSKSAKRRRRNAKRKREDQMSKEDANITTEEVQVQEWDEESEEWKVVGKSERRPLRQKEGGCSKKKTLEVLSVDPLSLRLLCISVK